MAKGTSGGIVNHPKVTDIDQFGKYLSYEEKVDWLKKTITDKSVQANADKIIKKAESYSLDGYHAIHDGSDKKGNGLLDSMIESPQAPVYDKTQYRGLNIYKSWLGMSPKEWIENVIAKGIWTEAGVTSFSASKDTAMYGFGGFQKGPHSHSDPNDHIHILITNKGHTHGMPFKHISKISSENEVLQSQKTMLKGMKIIGWHTNKSGDEYFIDVDDSQP